MLKTTLRSAFLIFLATSVAIAAWENDEADDSDTGWLPTTDGDITLSLRRKVDGTLVTGTTVEQVVTLWLKHDGKEPQKGVTTEDEDEGTELGWVRWSGDEEDGVENRFAIEGWEFAGSKQGQSKVQSGATFSAKHEIKLDWFGVTVNGMGMWTTEDNDPDHDLVDQSQVYTNTMTVGYQALTPPDSVPPGGPSPFPFEGDRVEGGPGVTVLSIRADVKCWHKGWWKGVNSPTHSSGTTYHEIRATNGYTGLGGATFNGYVSVFADYDS